VEDRIAEAATPRTRVICVSFVSYLTGYRLDLRRLASIAHAHGAVLAVDVSHALGSMPIPIEACDVLVSCCYKFALGVHGVGVFYLNQRQLAKLLQPAVGWFSIEWPGLEERSERYTLKRGSGRFELGNPSFVSIFVLREGLRVLAQVGSAAIEAHVLELGGRLRAGLVDLGLDVWTPEVASRRATNIVFGAADADRIVDRLRAHKVLAWSGDGRVRFSIHGFNDTADVDAAVAAVAAVV
jgi:cysteine desulfurase / selenocysteine lyase